MSLQTGEETKETPALIDDIIHQSVVLFLLIIISNILQHMCPTEKEAYHPTRPSRFGKEPLQNVLHYSNILTPIEKKTTFPKTFHTHKTTNTYSTCSLPMSKYEAFFFFLNSNLVKIIFLFFSKVTKFRDRGFTPAKFLSRFFSSC